MPTARPSDATGMTSDAGRARLIHPGEARLLAVRGSFRVWLAGSPSEIAAAQALRYDVFCREHPDVPIRDSGSGTPRDIDPFDDYCDHLLVCDDSDGSCLNGLPNIIGTYRLLGQEMASRAGSFYSENEYRLTPLLTRHRSLKFLELGRSCVSSNYRTAPVLELLWQGIWNYVRRNRIDVMFGCASFPGTDPDAIAAPLAMLAETAMAPPAWRARARPERYVDMRRASVEPQDFPGLIRALPPLLKGYLRLGAWVGDGAVVDQEFGTTDVLVMLPVFRIDQRYFSRFGRPHDFGISR